MFKQLWIAAHGMGTGFLGIGAAVLVYRETHDFLGPALAFSIVTILGAIHAKSFFGERE